MLHVIERTFPQNTSEGVLLLILLIYTSVVKSVSIFGIIKIFDLLEISLDSLDEGMPDDDKVNYRSSRSLMFFKIGVP